MEGLQNDEQGYRYLLESIGVSEPYLNAVDDQYRAIGRFYYHFGCIIRNAWISIDFLAHNDSPTGLARATRSALVNKTARHAMEKWFKYCQHHYPHNDRELGIARMLENEFTTFNMLRNTLAHGMITLGFGLPGDALPSEPSIFRLDHDSRVSTDPRLQSVAGIDRVADDLWHLQRRLSEYGSICLVPHVEPGLLGGMLTIREGKVERTIPLALRDELLTGG